MPDVHTSSRSLNSWHLCQTCMINTTGHWLCVVEPKSLTTIIDKRHHPHTVLSASMS